MQPETAADVRLPSTCFVVTPHPPRTRQSVTRINGGRAHATGAASAFVSDPVDLDMFHEVVIDTLMDAVSQQETMLARTFTKFEGLDDDEGLAFDESTRLFSIGSSPPRIHWKKGRSSSRRCYDRLETRTTMETSTMRATLPSPHATKNPLVHPRTTRRRSMLPWIWAHVSRASVPAGQPS